MMRIKCLQTIYGVVSELKTNIVLQYENDFKEVKSWGYPALYNNTQPKDYLNYI